MNRTKIPWATYSWNAIEGCSPASAGCAHCYAANLARRFGLPWGRAHFLPERLPEPGRVRRGGRVFVCSMADLGHETVEPAWRAAVYDAIRSSPQHVFITITKRPGPWIIEVPAPVWIGVSVEDQDHVYRWDELNEFRPSGVRFVSAEPMLGPVTFCGCSAQPDWVIAGPETGSGARPFNPTWLELLAAESPTFFDKREPGIRREYPALQLAQSDLFTNRTREY